MLLPVNSDVNNDFGAPGHLNAAAKLYLLYRDTDIDFLFLAQRQPRARASASISRATCRSNLEIHGEWARIEDAQRPGHQCRGQRDHDDLRPSTSYLLGLRYLTGARHDVRSSSITATAPATPKTR